MRKRKRIRKVKSAYKYIRPSQGIGGFQGQLIKGGYVMHWDKSKKTVGTGIPVREGKYHLRPVTIPALFRRSTQSRSIRWDRTFGERRTKWQYL